MKGFLRQPGADRGIDALLRLARDQLGMDVAFLNKFDGDMRTFRNLQTRIPLQIEAGFTEPARGSYCALIATGELDPVTPDTSKHPMLADLPVTDTLGIGAYVGVPLHRSDGSLYGTLCAFSRAADYSLRPRDAETLRALADVVTTLAEEEDRHSDADRIVRRRIEDLMATGGPRVVYQPIFELDGLTVAGMEALSRFPEGTPNPAEWFADAAAVGLGTELELLAIKNAVSRVDRIPGYLSVNASPATVRSAEFKTLLTSLPVERLVLELTEHHVIEDYAGLLAVLEPLRRRGLRTAVDDAGAGFASLRHVLNLTPNFIKLDISLVSGIDTDLPRQALAAALITFAAKTRASVVAEGIETEAELCCLQALDVRYGQGYHVGRPAPLAAARPIRARDPKTEESLSILADKSRAAG